MPALRSALAHDATACRSSPNVRRPDGPASPHDTSANVAGSAASKFSAKLSRAPGNHRGPSTGSGGAMRSPPATTASHGGAPLRAAPLPSSAITPQKRQTAAQNRSGCATDQPYTASNAPGASAASQSGLAARLRGVDERSESRPPLGRGGQLPHDVSHQRCRASSPARAESIGVSCMWREKLSARFPPCSPPLPSSAAISGCCSWVSSCRTSASRCRARRSAGSCTIAPIQPTPSGLSASSR